MSQIASRAAVLMATPLSADALAVQSSAASADATPVALVAGSQQAPTDVGDNPAPTGAGVAGDSTTVAGAAAATGAAPATSAAPAAAAAAPETGVAAFTRPAATTATTAQAGTPPAFGAPPSAAGGIGGAVTALIMVIALILALAWLAKRMPVLGGGAGSNPALRIVGSLALGPRERVIVVAVGDTQLLLGVGAGGTRTLHTLSEPLPVAASSTPAFAQVLAQHFGKKA